MVVFLQSHLGLAVPAGLALLGILLRWMVSCRYSRIAKQAERMNTTKDKYLKNWKIQFEELTGIRDGVKNVSAFVDKCMKKYRRCGLTLARWSSVSSVMVAFALLSGLVLAFGAYWYDLDYRLMVLYGSAGVVFAGTALLMGMLMNTDRKEERAHMAVRGYLENEFLPELTGYSGRRRRPHPLQSPKLTLEPEEEKVLKDVFQEFLT